MPWIGAPSAGITRIRFGGSPATQPASQPGATELPSSTPSVYARREVEGVGPVVRGYA